MFICDFCTDPDIERTAHLQILLVRPDESFSEDISSDSVIYQKDIDICRKCQEIMQERFGKITDDDFYISKG